MVYPVYTLQDPVPYVSMPTQSVETDSTKAEPTNAIPTYLEPLDAAQAYPYAGLSGIVPSYAANAQIASPYNPGAFSVQSGYEGYIVPGPPELVQQRANEASTELPFVGTITNSLTSLTSTLPVPIRSIATQAITILGALLGFTVLGGGLTTAICTLTPFCTISFALPFALPFARSGLKFIARPFVGEENAELLETTLLRLSQMQNKQQTELAEKTIDNGSVDTVKSSNGADITEDVASTIAKVAKVAKAAESAESAAVPMMKTANVEKSNDK